MSEHAVYPHRLSRNVAEIGRLSYHFSADLTISIFLWMVVDNFDLYTYTFKSLKLLTIICMLKCFPPWKLMII